MADSPVRGIGLCAAGADAVGMDAHSSTHRPHPNDRPAMALSLSRGFTSEQGVRTVCQFLSVTDEDTQLVLDIWRQRQQPAAERRAPDSPMRDPHPGRQCSSDCAEFGCASWTACG